MLRKELIPNDIMKELEKFPLALDKFSKLSYSHQKEYINYVEEAKQPQTRIRRIGKMILMLLDEK